MDFALLAPGPSASPALVERLRGQQLGVVTSAYPLAPWAAFLASSDVNWWRKHPEAKQFPGRKFTLNQIHGIERIHGLPRDTNSGVLALECARLLGATRIRLYGFDMRGSHYFGPYTNGCENTTNERRGQHMRQYRVWAARHKGIEVINCTPDSALECFPMGES